MVPAAMATPAPPSIIPTIVPPPAPSRVSTQYCLARKFGRELNLAVWWTVFAAVKLKPSYISYLHAYITLKAIPYRVANVRSTNAVAKQFGA